MQQVMEVLADTQLAHRPSWPGLKSRLAVWIRNYQTRKSLKKMEGRLLDDIGVDRTLADAESSKPFWQ